MGAEMDGKIKGILERGVDDLAEAINQSLQFLCRTASDDPLKAILLTGGGARIPGLLERLASRVEVPVEVANPFARVQLGRQLDELALEEMAPSLGVAMGLGTRRPGDT
jgi:type IV pilus assembly protein PilM